MEENYVIAKYDYIAQGTQELGLKKNERLLLLDDSKHWWRVQNSKGQSGYVPSNYVKREKPSIFDSIKKKVKKAPIGSSKTLPSGSPVRETDSPGINRRMPAEPILPSDALGCALVRYNYQAQQMDEISLVKGTRVLILEKSSDGWWKGQYNNQVGWFPSNYTIQETTNVGASAEDQQHMYSAAENVLDVVVALYNFQSQNEQELSFVKGERLEILDRPPADPDWFRARNGQGQIGLVPKNYLQEISDFLTEPFRGQNNQARSTLQNAVPPRPNNGVDAAMARSMDCLALNNSKFSSHPQLADKEWFFGAISRNECEQLLNDFGADGDFLVRVSETNVSPYKFRFLKPHWPAIT
ncbi:hypothetical protein QYM36_004923 [Artemia franciscana]|uniref:Uncharacterized protein n=1 Tax=Artemia franciscana TaxID=6661 RepID=A0AA88I6I2_ARTSF|nr:hypothetical protein QYM36_004923 [Artemia franciscana]